MSRRPTILFFAKKPMNVAMFRGILERLRERDDVRCVLAGKFEGGGSGKEVYARAGLPGETTVPTWWARWRPYDVYLCPDFNMVGRRSRTKVHMFHGVSLKNHAISERVREFDRLFVVGEYMRRTLVSRGILAEGDARLEMIGMPKLDALVDGSLVRDACITDLGLDPAEPTILYAPTWGEGSSLEAWGRHLLGILKARPEQVLIKLHDNSYDARKTSVDWAAALTELEGPRLKVVRDADVRPALVAADVLVSDASSVANEFLLLDRPVIFADCPGLLDRVARHSDLDTWGRKTGCIAADPAGLSSALDASFSDPAEHADVRRAAAEDIFHDPGGATERAVEALRRYAGCSA